MHASGALRSWIVVSAVWVLGSGIVWYQGFTTKQKQIAALDECGKIYPPLPEGLVTLNSKPFDPDYCVGKAATCNIFDQFDEPPAQPSLLSQFQADSAAADSERAAEKQHPHCAPNVGTINFLNFVSMHEPDREALRQHFENVIRSETQHAVVYGAGVPAGLLAFGLIMGWIVRGFRENHPR